MPTEQAHGLVLRVRPLTESSLIVHWLTREAGRLATVAKGARRPHSPFRGKLDLFFEAEFSFQRSRRSSLHALREVALSQTHPALRRDLNRLRVATYAALLVEQATEEETPIGEWHGLLVELLGCLDTGVGSPALVFAFELRVLALSGLLPADWPTSWAAEIHRNLELLRAGSMNTAGQVELAPDQVGTLRQWLGGRLTEGFGRVLRSRAAALGSTSERAVTAQCNSLPDLLHF